MECRLGELNGSPLERLTWFKRKAIAVESAATLSNSFDKKSARERRSHLRTHRERTSRLTKDCDVLRISAERSNVLLHPLQRRSLVHQAVVAGSMMRRLRSQLRMNKKSEDTEAI